MAVLFWGSVGAVAYAYFGYYVVLWVASRLWPRPVQAGDATPTLSIIIAAYNEASVIAAKLDNVCAATYPAECVQILVVSDGSTDAMESAVRAYDDARVTLIALPDRRGKELAQRAGLDAATGEICVFTDVATQLSRDGLREIVAPFADPAVGAVTSRNMTTVASGEGAFIRYDMALRAMESSLGSVVGLSGAFFAMRRNLCDVWPTDVPSDFYVVLVLVSRGYRAVFAPNATATYGVVASSTGEFHRKVRTVQRGIATLMRVPTVLMPWRTGFFAVQIFSHKLLRWCVPFCLVAAFLSCAALAAQPLYRLLFLAQVAYYALAALTLRMPALQAVVGCRMVGFMVLTNASILVAWLRYLRRGTVQVWQPSIR